MLLLVLNFFFYSLGVGGMSVAICVSIFLEATHCSFVDMQTFSCLTSRLDDPADKGWKEQFLDRA